MDKSNLQKRVAELDDMVRKLFSMQESQPQSRNQPRNSSFSRSFGFDLSERLAHSQKVVSRVDDQLAQYRRPEGTCLDAKVHANTQLKGEFFRLFSSTHFLLVTSLYNRLQCAEAVIRIIRDGEELLYPEASHEQINLAV